jgi:hypothetical protein
LLIRFAWDPLPIFVFHSWFSACGMLLGTQ